MYDSKIIDEALKEPGQPKEKKDKSSKEKLFEALLNEMYPQIAGVEKQSNPKFDRMRNLISIIEDGLCKLQEYESKKMSKNDEDIYSSLETNFRSIISMAIERLEHVWNESDEEEEEEKEEKDEEEESKNIVLQLQPEEKIISPQNIMYTIKEINNDVIRIVDDYDGTAYNVQKDVALKWRKKGE